MLIKHTPFIPAQKYIPAIPAVEAVEEQPEKFILEFTKEQLKLWVTVTAFINCKKSGMTYEKWNELNNLSGYVDSEAMNDIMEEFEKEYFK